MKLRCDENSVRMRFRKSDVKRLAESGEVSVTMTFPSGSTLEYRVRKASVARPAVGFHGGLLEILVPENVAAGWPSSPEVGIYGEQDGLQILLEKDFRRSSMPSPDDADRYDNPRAVAREATPSRT